MNKLGWRVGVMWLASLVMIVLFGVTDPDGFGATLVRLQWILWVGVCAGPVYLLRRSLMDGARSGKAFEKAMESATGAGLVFLGLCLLTGLLFTAVAARAEEVPANAKVYAPMLKTELKKHWLHMKQPSIFAGQIEQETCTSLKSKKCWSPYAELKTPRENGIGLGQVTVTAKFDNFAAARGLDKSLANWKWDDRYDPQKQLRTLVLTNKGNYAKLSYIVDSESRIAMMLAGYNGGMGGVSSDRRVCATVAGCNPNIWFGNVELHSLKAKTSVQGYGKSFFDINREYVSNIIKLRQLKYISLMEA